jgi:AraC-like DNA-binding protein
MTMYARQTWMHDVVNSVQVIALRASLGDLDPEHGRLILSDFARALPHAESPLEQVLLRGLLSEMAGRCSVEIHHQWHRGHAVAKCPFTAAASHEEFWKDSSENPTDVFRKWVDRFFVAFARAHLPSAAADAARLLEKHFKQPWSLTTLARRVHVTTPQLRRAFRRSFGMSPHDYQRAVRLVEALKHVPASKIDAVASTVGYRSKKNFYRAFQRLTGMTPTSFRRLSDARAAGIVRSINIRQSSVTAVIARPDDRCGPSDPLEKA